MLMGRLDVPSNPGYSPSRSSYADLPALVPTQTSKQRPSAFVAPREAIAPAYVPKPPDPSVGGRMGPQGFGWSTGLSEPRRWRQRFNGRTLVVPSMGVHPNVGPVGGDLARSQKLYNGTTALVHDYTVSNSTVADIMSRSFNPLLRDM